MLAKQLPAVVVLVRQGCLWRPENQGLEETCIHAKNGGNGISRVWRGGSRFTRFCIALVGTWNLLLKQGCLVYKEGGVANARNGGAWLPKWRRAEIFPLVGSVILWACNNARRALVLAKAGHLE